MKFSLGAVARLPPSRSMICAFFTIALTLFATLTSIAQTRPDKDYLVYVVSESEDKIALIRFGPKGARVDYELQTGDMPVDIDGPHASSSRPIDSSTTCPC